MPKPRTNVDARKSEELSESQRAVQDAWRAVSQRRQEASAHNPPPRRPRDADDFARNGPPNDVKRRRMDDYPVDLAPPRPPRDASANDYRDDRRYSVQPPVARPESPPYRTCLLLSTALIAPTSCSIHWHANNFRYHLQNLVSRQRAQPTTRLHTLYLVHDATAAELIKDWISRLRLHRIHLRVFALNKEDYHLPGVQETSDILTDITTLRLWGLGGTYRLAQRNATIAMRRHRLADCRRIINHTRRRISIAIRADPLV